MQLTVADFGKSNVGSQNITSVRYCVPVGFKLVLYDAPDFSVSEHKMEIIGTGEFGEIDFHLDDIQMDNVIQSARILPIEPQD